MNSFIVDWAENYIDTHKSTAPYGITGSELDLYLLAKAIISDNHLHDGDD